MSYEIKLVELPDQPTLVMHSTMTVGKTARVFWEDL